MAEKDNSERGQVLVIIALAIIGLIGLTGLAIDGSIALADRREAQHAADAAALAGALAYIQECGTTGCDSAEEISSAKTVLELKALDRAGSNGYGGDLIRSQVDIYTCDDASATCPAAYAGNPDYIQVIITSHVETSIAQAIGIPQIHNRVEAVALADDDDLVPLFDGRAIIALNPDCPSNGSMVIGGNAEVNITGGGVWTNADESCAFACTSSSVEINIAEGGLASPAGSFDKFSEHCQGNFGEGEITYNADPGIEYPLETPDLPVPDQCNSADPDNYHTSYVGTIVDPETGNTVEASFIYPGYYGKFPPAKDQVTGNNLKSNIFMLPGIYCVQEVKQTGGILLGDDVTVYVRPENGISFEGGITQLTATQSGDFGGYLVVVATNYPHGNVAACKINGGSYNVFQGAIFAPHCDVIVNGGSSTPDAGIDAQIIGYNVTIDGKAGLTINFDEEENPTVIDPPKIGITH